MGLTKGVRLAGHLMATLVFASAIDAGENINRRILIIPFDNMLSNKNYDWMSESISENLKAEILKSGRFSVMDATLLRKVNPNIQFANLTDIEATKLAVKLNCDAAIIGRYFIRKKGGKENVLIQTEGVDAISQKSVLIKSQYSEMDAAMFATVQNLAIAIAGEFNDSLPAITTKDVKRDAKLERFIARTENPPKGFIDTIGFGKFEISPEFDIDIFDYDVVVGRESTKNRKISLSYELWGKKIRPVIGGDNLTCGADACLLTSDQATLTIASSSRADAVKYQFKIRLAERDLQQEKSTAKQDALHADHRIHAFATGGAVLPIGYSENYLNKGVFGRGAVAIKLGRFFVPYAAGGAFLSSGKNSISSTGFYFANAGLAQPIHLTQSISLMPYLAAGILAGSLKSNVAVAEILVPALDGGLYLSWFFSQQVGVTISGAAFYAMDQPNALLFAVISAGVGLRF
jgi:TolB-like protein